MCVCVIRVARDKNLHSVWKMYPNVPPRRTLLVDSFASLHPRNTFVVPVWNGAADDRELAILKRTLLKWAKHNLGHRDPAHALPPATHCNIM